MPHIAQCFSMKDCKSKRCGVNLVSLHAKRALTYLAIILGLENIEFRNDAFNSNLDFKMFVMKKVSQLNSIHTNQSLAL